MELTAREEDNLLEEAREKNFEEKENYCDNPYCLTQNCNGKHE